MEGLQPLNDAGRQEDTHRVQAEILWTDGR